MINLTIAYDFWDVIFKLQAIFTAIFAIYGIFLISKKNYEDGIIWIIYSVFFFTFYQLELTEGILGFMFFLMPILIYLIIKKTPITNTKK